MFSFPVCWSCLGGTAGVWQQLKRFHAVYTAFLAHLSLLRCTYLKATGLLIRDIRVNGLSAWYNACTAPHMSCGVL